MFKAIILILIVSFNLSAKTIIIADIDDTLKISHVHSKVDAFFNMFQYDVVFKGMPQLFQKLAKQEIQITYLSNAPRWLMGKAHPRFLRYNHFPKGEIILRSNLGKDKHKLVNMRNIIHNEQPDTVILIGDNGQNDPKFQAQIRQEFPNINIYSFIHVVYNISTLPTDTFTFVTPLELTIQLRNLGIITDSTADQLLIPTAQGIVDEFAILNIAHYIPYWVRCRGHQFDATNELPLVQQAAQKINRQCKKK